MFAKTLRLFPNDNFSCRKNHLFCRHFASPFLRIIYCKVAYSLYPTLAVAHRLRLPPYTRRLYVHKLLLSSNLPEPAITESGGRFPRGGDKAAQGGSLAVHGYGQ